MSEESFNPLSVAFIWHMHQPRYKDDLTGEYLMPWVRLHAIKDYLDMVAILEKYPKIRQTFNLVPSLIDQLEDYCNPDTHDRHTLTTLTPEFSEADKQFIFERFFDASPQNMIAKSSYYFELFQRRNHLWEQGDSNLSVFTLQEYRDITVLFNLVWFDPLWFETNPALQQLWQKQKNYTLEDAQKVIEIQRELIRKTLDGYREAQQRGQIEVTTTPYYHPILPLLIDSESAKTAMLHAVMPEESFQFAEDAAYQVNASREKYRAIFGHDPQGVWPAEQSISPAAIRMLKDHGFDWAVSSEGNLSQSLGIPLEKDPYGNIRNVEMLCQPYHYAGMKLLFRHLTLSDLIGFHYATLPAHHAVDDFIHRLHEIRRRCSGMGLKHPIVTIALDGENCWECFPNDGHEFLNMLYTRLSEDSSFNVCRVQDYFEALPSDEPIPELQHLHSGSWINSNFHIWIADPVKNAAWMHLKRTRSDLVHLSQTGHYQPEVLKQAWEEIYIAQGSDWFWWYGEPHNSGQDDVFDMQFRRHLANVYRLMDLEIPNFLEIPLSVSMGRPVNVPAGHFTPVITGSIKTQDNWELAGTYDLTHGAMHRGTRILRKVHFGSDKTQFYLRFELNSDAVAPHHDIVLYLCTPGKTRHNSPIRIKGASGHTVSTQRYHYAYEIQIGNLVPGQVKTAGAESLPDHLWYNRPDLVSAAAYEDVVDIAVPFEGLNVWPEEYVQLSIALVQGGILEEFQPENFVLSIRRQSLIPVPAPLSESQEEKFSAAW